MAEALALNGGPKAVTREWPSWPALDEEAVAEVNRVLRDEQLSQLGGTGIVGQLEKEFASYQGRKFPLACNGGTAALDIAVAVSGAGPGDEVITSPYTWGATVGCIIHNNAIPIFADIHPETLTLDPESVRSKLTPRTKAIVVVHIYGHPTDMDPIMGIADERGIKVIEDCAQAHGATYKGRKVGSLGHFGAFSLQASKNLIGGEGGILFMDEEGDYFHALSVATHPARQATELPLDSPWRDYIDSLQPNYRIHPLAAAIAKAGLKHLDPQVSARQANAVRLAEGLEDVPGVRVQRVSPDCTHAYHMIPLFFVPEELPGVDREKFCQALRAEGVPIFSYVHTPIHLRGIHRDWKYYGKGCPWSCPFAERHIRYSTGDCPVAERHCDQHELNLGSGGLYEDQSELIGQVVNAFHKVAANADRLVSP